MQEEAQQKFKNQTIIDLNRKYRTQWALQSAESLLAWDLEVNMPPAGSVSRGQVMAEVSLISQQKMGEIYPLLDRAKDGDLNDYEKGVVRTLRRKQKYFTRIPPSLIERKSRLASEASVVWRDARKRSDFRSFEPYLEKIVELKQEEAEKLGYEDHPYDALLDQFEEGLTVKDADLIFARLIPALKDVLAKVEGSKFTEKSSLSETSYPIDAMTAVNYKLVDLLQMPKDRFRMDVSTHPFEDAISRDDVRITTRYEGSDFKRVLFSTVHESGHAIYELQIDESLQYTPIGISVSNGYHESQSRFWENVIGRSRAFILFIRPLLVEDLSFVAPFNDQDLYYYFNYVRPGTIRVDADELTYNFHTALRYDIEKKVIAGEIKVSELPQIWSDTLDKYLEIRPSSDAEGVLQDVHWSHGDFGYFATYTLGNVIAGMIWHSIRQDLPLEDEVRRGNFDLVKRWLYQKIHRWGATYSPKELAVKSFGEPINPDRLVEYLKWKYET